MPATHCILGIVSGSCDTVVKENEWTTMDLITCYHLLNDLGSVAKNGLKLPAIKITTH